LYNTTIYTCIVQVNKQKVKKILISLFTHLERRQLFVFKEQHLTLKAVKIILQVAILYAFSVAGEAVHQLFNLPIPGSIIGLLFLLICLTFNIIPVKLIEKGASFLLSFLPLLFIPAMAGVINYPSLFSGSGAILLLVVVLSTIVTMAAAGIASQLLEKRVNKRKEKKKCRNSLSQSL
jgi:holin-like protein